MLCDNCKAQIKPICQRCGQEFKRTNGNQRFCGNIRQKTGCAYDNRMEKQLGYAKAFNRSIVKRTKTKLTSETQYKQMILPEQRAEQQPIKTAYWFTQ